MVSLLPADPRAARAARSASTDDGAGGAAAHDLKVRAGSALPITARRSSCKMTGHGDEHDDCCYLGAPTGYPVVRGSMAA